jgi:hypothetical protein
MMGETLDEPRDVSRWSKCAASLAKLNRRCFMMQVFSCHAGDVFCPLEKAGGFSFMLM